MLECRFGCACLPGRRCAYDAVMPLDLRHTAATDMRRCGGARGRRRHLPGCDRWPEMLGRTSAVRAAVGRALLSRNALPMTISPDTGSRTNEVPLPPDRAGRTECGEHDPRGYRQSHPYWVELLLMAYYMCTNPSRRHFPYW